MKNTMDKVWLCLVTFYLISLTAVVDADCPNRTGIILGSIFGTLAVVILVLGILAVIWKCRGKKGKSLGFIFD